MHVGSAMALSTEEPILHETNGTFKPRHKFARPFTEKWNSIPDLLWQKPHILSLNGEPFNGINKNKTVPKTGVMT